MKNQNHLLLASCIFAILSCKNKSSDHLAVFKSINETLEQTARQTKYKNETIFASLDEKRTDPALRVKAEYWFFKLSRINKEMGDISNYIEEIKSALIREAGRKWTIASGTSFEEGNKKAVFTVLQKQDNAKKLFWRIKGLKDTLLHIDPQIEQEFKSSLQLLPRAFDTVSNSSVFVASFNDLTAMEALVVMNQLQAHFFNQQNHLFAFCHEQTARVVLDCRWDAAIINQNSKVLKAGDNLEIEAGIGSFKTTGHPIVIIGKNVVLLNDGGMAVTKLKCPSAAGNYSVPIRIEFTDADGKLQVFSKTVSYTVVADSVTHEK